MEIYELGTDYRLENPVDDYKSFIWTERYDSYGDFQIVCYPGSSADRRFTIGKIIRIRNHIQGMEVEERTLRESDDGSTEIVIKGRTLTRSMLANRAVGPRGGVEYVATNPPGQIIAGVVAESSIHGGWSNRDIIPELWTVNSTTNTTNITYTIEMQDLYTFIERLAKEYNLGFRLDVRFGSPKLGFIVYNGRNRRDSVIFRRSMGHMTNYESLESNRGYYTTAQVFGKEGQYVEIVSVGNQGFYGRNRRVLLVDGTDIDLELHTEEKARRLLRQRGWTALGQHKYARESSGVVTHDVPYSYGVDGSYYLGDTVGVENYDGSVHPMQVSEYTIVSDEEGVRRYPTFRTVES